jgi:hypothetical protein
MRNVGIALTLVCVVGFGSSAASAQQGDDCREVVRSIASVRGTSIVAKVRGRERAIGRWRDKVSARYGNGFRTWLKAHQRSVNCDAAGSRTMCRAEGFPCRKF